jgi:hypothetical protein
MPRRRRGYVAPDASGGTEFDPTSVKLRAATSFHAGEPVFIAISAPDENRDAATRESMTITLKTTLGDKETLKVWETGPTPAGSWAIFRPRTRPRRRSIARSRLLADTRSMSPWRISTPARRPPPRR